MTTLSAMKTRIISELGDRTDLTTEIANAINDAIVEYQSKRFYFSDSRSVTFNTVIDQEFYTSADHASIPNLYRIDLITVDLGGIAQEVTRNTNSEIELLNNISTQTGDPVREFAYFAQQLRFHPIPTAVRAIRVLGHIKFDAPASDAATGNVWMTEAEKLIRSRAKYELALHKLSDDDMATKMAAAVTEQLSTLGIQTGRRVGRGRVRATRF